MIARPYKTWRKRERQLAICVPVTILDVVGVFFWIASTHIIGPLSFLGSFVTGAIWFEILRRVWRR